MKSSNIRPSPLTGKPWPPEAPPSAGKPPKLTTRLRMASLTAPQRNAEPWSPEAPPSAGKLGRRDLASGFFAKRRMLGWGIGFLIAVVVALSVVIKLVQAEVKNEKSSNLAAVEQLGKLQASVEAVEKEKTTLKTHIAELEQKAQISGQLQTELAKARVSRAEAEASLQQATAAKAAADQGLATLKARLAEVSQQVLTIQEQARQVQTLQDEIGKENQRQATAVKAAAEQDLAMLKARLAEVSQQVVTVREQAQQVQTLQDKVSRESQRQESLLQDAAKAYTAIQAANGKRADSPASVDGTLRVEQAYPVRGAVPSGTIKSAPEVGKATAPSEFLSVGSEAKEHFKAGFRKWDEGNVEGSMAEFKKTVRLDNSSAASYYNIALGYINKGDLAKACDYLYRAGEIYLKNKNNKQAQQVVEFMRIIDPSSSLANKLYAKIANN